MIILPAIDLRKGRCVRLRQGDPTQETVFADDPVAVARRWEAAGATWIHVVDLDGAFSGSPQNAEAIRALVAAVSVPVQLGGGLRTLDHVAEAIRVGVARVVLGTAAVEQPELVAEAAREFPGRIAVGIDARDGRVAVRGWQQTTSRSAIALAKEMAAQGVAAFIYTDIARDGTLTGPNVAGIAAFAEAVDVPVIASGGVSRLEDVRRLAALEPLGVVGVIIGRALYEGTFSLSEALAVAAS